MGESEIICAIWLQETIMMPFHLIGLAVGRGTQLGVLVKSLELIKVLYLEFSKHSKDKYRPYECLLLGAIVPDYVFIKEIVQPLKSHAVEEAFRKGRYQQNGLTSVLLSFKSQFNLWDALGRCWVARSYPLENTEQLTHVH
ncbi:hypothetical protein TNCV_4306091 [Trichonephila clavipes]|nr:hypothetical protein TNCV_4306091 [Trichonephila clavipes]